MRISVVIPAFDVEPWVASAIESALQQHPPPEEVIVVDDGSTDGTADVASRFPGVRVVHQENRGLAAARNAGAATATTDTLLFLDADDLLLPGAVGGLVAAVDDDDAWSAVVPNFVLVGGERPQVAWTGAPSTQRLGRDELPRLLRANPLAANALVRRDVWDALRFREDLRAAEDLDFWLRLVLAGERITVLGDPLVVRRVDRAGALTGRRALMRESRRRVFELVWRRRDLTARERALVAYQLVRVTAGEMVARRVDGAMNGPGPVDSSNSVVRATRFALALPGLVPGLAMLDGARRR